MPANSKIANMSWNWPCKSPTTTTLSTSTLQRVFSAANTLVASATNANASSRPRITSPGRSRCSWSRSRTKASSTRPDHLSSPRAGGEGGGATGLSATMARPGGLPDPSSWRPLARSWTSAYSTSSGSDAAATPAGPRAPDWNLPEELSRILSPSRSMMSQNSQALTSTPPTERTASPSRTPARRALPCGSPGYRSTPRRHTSAPLPLVGSGT
mmetsp:Transcript_98734/g.275823  ORF Transcript_98734/g.275823 Transcript_98734/m.275823 type:complete len:213 (+) Transcript_98734:316-954(+)